MDDIVSEGGVGSAPGSEVTQRVSDERLGTAIHRLQTMRPESAMVLQEVALDLRDVRTRLAAAEAERDALRAAGEKLAAALRGWVLADNAQGNWNHGAGMMAREVTPFVLSEWDALNKGKPDHKQEVSIKARVIYDG
jgi:hypothetical protein